MGAWSIAAWPRVECPVADFRRIRFRHWSTQVTDLSRPGGRSGSSIWVAASGYPVALAWDWTEVHPWVIVLSDPMRVLTNAELVDEERSRNGGRTIGPSEAVELNEVIHRLPWQTVAVRQVRLAIREREPALAT